MPQVIDVNEALERVGGNEALLIRVMSIFHKTYGNVIGEIRTALREGQLEEACRKVHTLKGVAASLSAKAVFEIAKELEASMRNGGESEWEGLISELDVRVAAARAFAFEVDRSQSLHPETVSLTGHHIDDGTIIPGALLQAEGPVPNGREKNRPRGACGSSTTGSLVCRSFQLSPGIRSGWFDQYSDVPGVGALRNRPGRPAESCCRAFEGL